MNLQLILARRAAADYRGARRAAVEAVAVLEGPERIAVLVELGRLHHDFGDSERAAATLKGTLVVAEGALRARALAYLAKVLRDQGRPEEAGQVLAEAERLDPSAGRCLRSSAAKMTRPS